MESIVEVLVRRDGMTRKEAVEQVNDFTERAFGGELCSFEIEEMFMSDFGLEPDYLIELMEGYLK